MNEPNKNVPMPKEYEEMMRHYLPTNTPKAVIVDAWKHAATPAEVIANLDRISKLFAAKGNGL